ncbi:unnamed protein product, partial [Didymodactylos carnosus]
MHNPRGLPRES